MPVEAESEPGGALSDGPRKRPGQAVALGGERVERRHRLKIALVVVVADIFDLRALAFEAPVANVANGGPPVGTANRAKEDRSRRRVLLRMWAFRSIVWVRAETGAHGIQGAGIALLTQVSHQPGAQACL